MAKRRTKKQKVEARISYHLPAITEIETQSTIDKKTASDNKVNASILMYDVHFLKTDLIKTGLLSLVILGLELILYYYWR